MSSVSVCKSFGIFALLSILLIFVSCDLSMADGKNGSPASNKAAFTGYVYVSTSGNDTTGNGSSGQPYRTLAYAATKAVSGNTIKLLAGTFLETKPAIVGLGVSIEGAGQGQTILKSSGVELAPGISPTANDWKLWYDGSLIQLTSPHFVEFRNPKSAAIAPANGSQTLSGFTIDGDGKKLKAGVWVENRNNVTMHSVTIQDCQMRGAVFATGDKDWYIYPDFYMTGIKIYNCTFLRSGMDIPYNPMTGSGAETLGNLCIGTLDGAEIYNITISDQVGYGIKFIFDGFLKNTKVHDVNITLNETDATWGEKIAIEWWNIGPGNEIYNVTCNTWLSMVNHPLMFNAPASAGENLKIYNVKMIDTDGVSSKEAMEIALPGVDVYNSYIENKGFGMAIWDMGREKVRIRNNIFRNTRFQSFFGGDGPAIYIENSRTWNYKEIDIVNNVFDYYKSNAVKVMGRNVDGVNIKNNLFLNTRIDGQSDIMVNGADLTNIRFENNLKFGPTTDFQLNGVTLTASNISGDPGLKKTGAYWDTYYQPSSGSSFAVNKGTTVGLPYSGAAPDIGAFEFGGSGTTTTSTTNPNQPTTTTSTTTTTVLQTALRYEAENSIITGGFSIQSKYTDTTYTTTFRYVNEIYGNGNGLKWTNVSGNGSSAQLKLRYTSRPELVDGFASGRGLEVWVNGSRASIGSGTLIPFTNKNLNYGSDFTTVNFNVSIPSGTANNSVELRCKNTSWGEYISIDWLEVALTGTGGTTTTSLATTTTVPVTTTTTVPATTTTLAPVTTTTTVARAIYPVTKTFSSGLLANYRIYQETITVTSSSLNLVRTGQANVNTGTFNTTLSGAQSAEVNRLALLVTNADVDIVPGTTMADGANVSLKLNDTITFTDIKNGAVHTFAADVKALSDYIEAIVVANGLNDRFKPDATTTTTTTTVPPTTTSTTTTSTTTTTVSVPVTLTNGTYNMKNVGSTKSQSAESWAGGAIFNADYTGASVQKWTLTAVGQNWKIVNLATGYCINASGPSTVNEQTYTGTNAQLWTISSIGSGQFKIVNVAYGSAARSQDVWNGNPMVLGTYDGTSNFFKWTFSAP